MSEKIGFFKRLVRGLTKTRKSIASGLASVFGLTQIDDDFYEELEEILADDSRPVFVAASDDDSVLGYAFCVYQQHVGSNNMTDVRTLYIDDLCVDERSRGQHVGRTLYEHVVDFARREGFYNVTLNVWSCNPGAQAFYEAMGMQPYRIGMEVIL
jgi:ribosomal protein S18 acetylase RimI-like enzyme